MIEPKPTFNKAKEILKTLEGFSYQDCKQIIQTLSNHIAYREKKTLKEVKFTYEDLRVG
jgi:hypothetical protein